MEPHGREILRSALNSLCARQLFDPRTAGEGRILQGNFDFFWAAGWPWPLATVPEATAACSGAAPAALQGILE